LRKVTLLSFFIITIAISLVFTSQIAFSEHSERTSKSNLPKVEFDKKTYLLDDTLEITITDNVENHNPNKQESIYFKIYSELFRSGVLVEAEETNENSGIFTMDFKIIQLSSSNGEIKASYSYSIRDKNKTLNATSQIVEPISETEEKKPEIKTPPEPKITPPEKHPEPIIFSKSAFGSLRVESGEYVLSEKVGSTTISISGKLTYEKIVPVHLIIMKPDETIETVEVRVLDDGSFVYQILLEPNSEPGFYQIRAKFGEGQFGPVSYIVVESKVPNWIRIACFYLSVRTG